MSFDIGGIDPSQAAQRVTPAASVRAVSAPAAQVGATDEAVEVETMPPGPPASVMAAISVAANAYNQLHESGRHVHFGTDPQTGRLSARLQDLEGNDLAAVTPGQVLAIATGQPA